MADAIAALKTAEAILSTVLDQYVANSAAWTTRYTTAENAVEAAQAALTKALATATPPKPVAWHLIGSQTLTGTLSNLYLNPPRVQASGYYTGGFKATVTLNKALPPQDDAYALKPYIVVDLQCVGAYGLGQKSGQSSVRFGSTVTSAAAIAGGPVHTRDCEPYAQFSTGDLNAYSADAWNVVRTVGVSLYYDGTYKGENG